MSILADPTPADVPALQARVRELEERLAEVSAGRHAAEARLGLFEAIVERVPLGLHIYRLEDADDDRSLVLLAANGAAAAMTGVPSEQIVGRAIDANFPDLRAQNIPQTYAAVARGGEPFAVESLHYGDERVIAAAFAVQALPLPDRCLAVAFENITERKRIEQALRASETRLQVALDVTGAGVSDLNLSTGALWLSEQYQAILGYAPGEHAFTLEEWMAIGHPDDAAELTPLMEACLAGQTPSYRMEARVRHKSGGWIWVSGQGKAVEHGPDGRATRLIGTIVDITDDRRAEEQLRLFETLAETALDGVAYADLDGVLEYGNAAFCAMTGFGANVVGTSIPGFFGPAEQPYIHEVMLPALRSAGQWSGTLPALRPDGTIWTAQVSIFTLADARGTPHKLAGVCRDMTLQQTQEQRLRQVDVMVENAPDGFTLIELDGRIAYLNPAFRAMLGYAATPVGAPLLQFFADHEHARLPQLVQRVLQEGHWQGVLCYRRADGSTFDAQITAFVVRDGAGTPIALAGVARDLTEEQQRERERTTLQEQVIAAQQAALRELSTPLIPLANGVVAMPLIGSIDSSRAQQVLETLLEGVAATGATTAILDITGVPVVDTQVANALIRAAQAVKLLGARVVLTGIRPEVAQTLVGLGADLSSIITRSSLQAGIAFAMDGK